MKNKAKNLFILHSSRDRDVFRELQVLLKERYACIDGALPGSRPGDAANENFVQDEFLIPRIASVDALVVVISPATRERSWVDGAIESAQKMGRRIVGVYGRGGTKSDLPKSFEKYGDALVDCQQERVRRAIEDESDIWLEPDGVTPCAEREIDRFSCGGDEEVAA